MPEADKEWFEEWFESPYYDLLYTKRNEEEAALFLDNILNFLRVPLNLKVLDLACGKGRHSIYLNKKGFDVTGFDLSCRSINHAKKFEKQGLSFIVNDMRVPLKQKFDIIFNLFTSFGYFDTEEENLKVLHAVTSMLLPEGIFILDFLNGQRIPSDLDYNDSKSFPEADFKIHKKVENGFVLKSIQILASGKRKDFTEKVRLYSDSDFQRMFEKCGLAIIETFGDYNLGKFDQSNSDRMIYITKRK